MGLKQLMKGVSAEGEDFDTHEYTREKTRQLILISVFQASYAKSKHD